MNRFILCAGLGIIGVTAVAMSLGAKKPADDPKTLAHMGFHHAPMKALFLEPPALDQIKADLNGKTVTVGNQPHTFSPADLDRLAVMDTRRDNDGVVLNLVLKHDTIVAQRTTPTRWAYTKETLLGSVRASYVSEDGRWVLKSLTNVNCRKFN